MDKFQKTIIKLNKDTQNGIIRWRTTQAPASIISIEEQLTGPAYTTNLEDRTLLLIKYRSKYYIEDSIEGYTWVDRASLFIMDNNLPGFDFGNYKLVLDLYESVQYQTSNVDDFMNKLLGEELEDDEV